MYSFERKGRKFEGIGRKGVIGWIVVEGVVAVLCICFVVAVVMAVPNVDLRVHAKTAGYTVVIDAGHGGKDRGASGKNGIYESDINLAIAKFLRYELQIRGVDVVMTRETGDWLASSFAPNKKRDDLNERRKIIERAKPELVISIHLNTYPDSSVRGLQCFYNKGGEISKKYADSVQTEFNYSAMDISRTAKTGDYYILDCTQYPSILVECGFLSNEREEKMLATTEYQRVLAYYIASAVYKQQLKNFIY